MHEQSHKLAYCVIVTSLIIVIMFLLSVTGIGTYAGPMVACLLLVPVREKFGIGTGMTVFAASGLLSLMLCTDKEQAIVYIAIIGWYPVLKPCFDKIKNKALRSLCKLGAFNLVSIASYMIMIPFLGLTEEMLQPWLWWLVLAFGNAMFVFMDVMMIPKVVPVFEARISRAFRRK